MELRIPTSEQLKSVYEGQLKQAFPASELKPLQSIEELWRDGLYRPWCLFDGDEIVGACFLWLGRPGWALLDYLCVSADHRNRGIGALLLSMLLEQEPDLTIFGESELPSHAPDPVMAEHRLGFYARNGAKTAGYETALFGVPYKTLYWSKKPVDDSVLMEQHRHIYESRFSLEKLDRFIRIPYDPAEPLVATPWEE